jgi:hypothetical protein
MCTVPISLIHPRNLLFNEKVIQSIETVLVSRLNTPNLSPLIKLKSFIRVPLSDDDANIDELLLIERQATLFSFAFNL